MPAIRFREILNCRIMRTSLYLILLVINGMCGLGMGNVVLMIGKEEVLEGEVSSSNDREYLIQSSPPGPVRIHTEAALASIHYPVVFMIRTGYSVKSWRIPSKSSGNSSEYSSTICSGPDDGNDLDS